MVFRKGPLPRAAIARNSAERNTRRKGDRAEQVFQITSVVPYLKAVLDPADTFWFHVPNGGARSAAEGAILKAMGVKAGVPDIVVLALVEADYPTQWMHRVCLIELKRPDGKGDTNKNQDEVHEALVRLNMPPAVCQNLDEVRAALEAASIPMRRHTMLPTGGYVVPPDHR